MDINISFYYNKNRITFKRALELEIEKTAVLQNKSKAKE